MVRTTREPPVTNDRGWWRRVYDDVELGLSHRSVGPESATEAQFDGNKAQLNVDQLVRSAYDVAAACTASMYSWAWL